MRRKVPFPEEGVPSNLGFYCVAKASRLAINLHPSACYSVALFFDGLCLADFQSTGHFGATTICKHSRGPRNGKAKASEDQIFCLGKLEVGGGKYLQRSQQVESSVRTANQSPDFRSSIRGTSGFGTLGPSFPFLGILGGLGERHEYHRRWSLHSTPYLTE
jgi:hypothetical protein